MSRTVISTAELQKWLTTEIRKFEDCEECSFGEIMPLRQPDKSGFNWSDDIVLRMTGVSPEIYLPAAKSVMAEARRKFNIKTSQ
jgi:hypothetical protein